MTAEVTINGMAWVKYFYSIKVENKGEDLRVVLYYQYGNILLLPGVLQGCYMCHHVLNQGGENFSINGYNK